MTHITWGPEIAVNGVKPAWLADDDVCCVGSGGSWHGKMAACRPYYWSWPSVTAIRLPADHWAYPVIEKGFWPWAGGDQAPEDWDGGEVLLREGSTIPSIGNSKNWQRGFNGDPEKYKHLDIIGYRRRTDATASVDPDTVTLKRMTEGEARQWAKERGLRNGYLTTALEVMTEFGLIRDETPLERFARETKTEITDDNRAAIEAALKWGRE